jgi:quercetin dioxygenase-like cupin family protein
MKIIRAENEKSKPNPHGVDARTLSDSVHATVVQISMNPGQELKKHLTPVDVLFYVLEGDGTVEIGDERSTVGAGTLIESPAKIPHKWINDGKGLLRILVIKTPRPSEATKVL